MAKSPQKIPPPQYLVRRAQASGKGGVLLQRLIKSDQMHVAWTQLDSLINTDSQWEAIYQKIRYATRKAGNYGRVPDRRSDEERHYKKLAERLSKLCVDIEETPGIDVLAYEFWPLDSLSALGVKEWPDNPLRRDEAARQLLGDWPSASELLNGLSRIATNLAKTAKTKDRPDLSNKGDVQLRTFAWNLIKDFEILLGKPMEIVVAKIASVVLERDVQDDYVIELARSMKRKSRGKNRQKNG